MRFLFATGRPHWPDQVSGAGRSMHTLLELLREQGHECEVIAGLRRGWRRRTVRAIAFLSRRRRFSVYDRHNGYRTHRTLHRWLAAAAARRIDAFHPDVVMTQLAGGREIAAIALARGVPVTLSVHDAEFHRWNWPAPHSRLVFIANCRFIANRLRDQLDLESEIVYPVIRLENYKVSSRVREFVAFVNPVPNKGLDLVMEIAAALPNCKFLFVEGWPLQRLLRRQLLQRLRRLPNVAFTRWTPDMRTVYSRAALLILPSQSEEAFARVIPEAQANGIPVLARDVGGVAESVGPSGVLLSRKATATDWADEIQRLLTDGSYYASRSAAAIANTTRPEFDPNRQMERYLSVVSNL